VGTLAFTLSNGQVDELPAASTVSAAHARAAVEHFFTTGAVAPFLDWRADVSG
jgi:hypothetical protein